MDGFRISKTHVYLFFVLLSGLYSFLLIGSRMMYFPYFSFFVILASLSSLVYFTKHSKDKYTLILYVLSLILSAFIVLRANLFLTFLNIGSVVYLVSALALRNSASRKELGLVDALASPILLSLNLIFVKNHFVPDFHELAWKIPKPDKKIDFTELVIAIVITCVVLLVIIPLLAFANPVFQSYVKNFFGFFSIDFIVDIIKKIFGENLFVAFWRVAFFGFFILVLPRLISMVRVSGIKSGESSPESVLPFSLLIPKIAVGIILIVFFISQIELYLATPEALAQLGYSNSKFAREVFAQLSVVALIIFGLIYPKQAKTRLNKFLSYFLVCEGIFLTFIALKSVFDYTSSFGFTIKRLYGYAGIIWIITAFGLFLYNYFRNLQGRVLVKKLIVFTGSLLVLINIVNFDYLIYHNRKSTTEEGIDYAYLSTLSADGDYYPEYLAEILAQIDDMAKKPDFTDSYRTFCQPASIEIRIIGTLVHNYSEFDIRNFNLSEYLQYLKIKDIDLDALNKQIGDTCYKNKMVELNSSGVVNVVPENELDYLKDIKEMDSVPYMGEGVSPVEYYISPGVDQGVSPVEYYISQ